MSLLGTLHVPFLLVLFPWASPMGLDPLFPFAGRKDGGCWSVLGPFSRASRSNLKLTSLTSRGGEGVKEQLEGWMYV